MATTRASGYVVTAAVWNAVLNKLTDDGNTYSGAFNGSSVAGTTGSFSSTLAVTGAVTLSSTLAASGVATFSAGANRAVQIARSGSNSAGLSIANADRTYGIAIDSGDSHILKIQEDTDGSPRVQVDAANNQIGFAATAGVTNTNYYHSATEQPGFLAYNSSSDTGVTSGSTVDFDTEVYDDGGDFSGDTFTAPVAGRYLLVAYVELTNASGGTASVNIDLVTSNRTYQLAVYPTLANGNTIAIGGTAIADMDAADTARIVFEGSANITIAGSAAARTYFCGRLLP